MFFHFFHCGGDKIIAKAYRDAPVIVAKHHHIHKRRSTKSLTRFTGVEQAEDAESDAALAFGVAVPDKASGSRAPLFRSSEQQFNTHRDRPDPTGTPLFLLHRNFRV